MVNASQCLGLLFDVSPVDTGRSCRLWDNSSCSSRLSSSMADKSLGSLGDSRESKARSMESSRPGIPDCKNDERITACC
jgi:hypothetical protein